MSKDVKDMISAVQYKLSAIVSTMSTQQRMPTIAKSRFMMKS